MCHPVSALGLGTARDSLIEANFLVLWRGEHLLEFLLDEQGLMSLVPYILLA